MKAGTHRRNWAWEVRIFKIPADFAVGKFLLLRLRQYVFWPSRLTVRAASRNNPRLRPLRPGGRENPIDKKSVPSPRVSSVSGLLPPPGSRSRAPSLQCPTGGHPAFTGRDLGSWLPALFHRLFPRSTRLSWAQPPRPIRAGGRRRVRDGPRGPAPRSCGSRPPPWPPGMPGRAVPGPRSRDSGKRGAWWGSWPWRRRQLLPLQ